jgi:hypothetical protein
MLPDTEPTITDPAKAETDAAIAMRGTTRDPLLSTLQATWF